MVLAELLVKIGADLSDFNKEMGKVTDILAATGKKMQSVGTKMTIGLTAPIAAFGVAAIKTAGEFETGMNRVKALTGATGQSLSDLEDLAKSLGATTQFSAGQAADAMGFLAQAGFDTDQILGSMEATLNLAASAQMELGAAADIVSNVMTGYGLSADESSRATDVLAKAFTSANTDLQQLGEAMKLAGPVAKGAGLTFEGTAAAIGLLGNAGLQASVAGTTLRGAIARLQNPTKATGDALAELGLNVSDFKDSDGNIKPLVEIVELLEDKAGFSQKALEIFGLRAGPGMQALVSQGSGALQDLTTELENSGGTAERIGNVQMEGFAGAIKQLKSAFESLKIAIGATGLLDFLTRLIEKTAGFFRKLADLDPMILQVGVAIASAVAVVGPLLAAFGTVLTLLPLLSAGFATLGIAGGPVFATVAAISALVAGISLLVMNWDTVTAFMQESWLRLKLAVVSGIADMLSGFEGFAQFIPGVGDAVAAAATIMRQKTGEAALALSKFKIEQDRAKTSTDEGKVAAEQAAPAVDALGDSLGATGDAAGGASVELKKMSDVVAGSNEPVETYISSLQELAGSAGFAAIAAGEAVARIDDFPNSTKKAEESVGDLSGALQRVPQSLEEPEWDLLDPPQETFTRIDAIGIRFREMFAGVTTSFKGVIGSLTGKDGLKGALGTIGGILGGTGTFGGALKGLIGNLGSKGVGGIIGSLAGTAFPGLGVAMGAIGPVLDKLGIDMDKVFSGITAGAGLAVKAIGNIFGIGAKARERSNELSNFATGFEALGIDPTQELNAQQEAAVRSLLNPFLTRGIVSSEDLLSSVGLSADDIQLDLQDFVETILDPSNVAVLAPTAVDQARLLIGDLQNGTGPLAGLMDQFGVSQEALINIILDRLNVSRKELDRRLAEIAAGTGTGGVLVGPDGELIGGGGGGTVIPTDKLGGAVDVSDTRSGPGDMGGINVNVNLDGQRLGELMMPRIEREIEVNVGG